MFELKKQLMWSKLKAGAVVTLALAILFITVFFAGGLEKIFTPKIEIDAQVRDVKGLRKGAPVWISGIEVGSVKDIRLHPSYGTLVKLAIDKDAAAFIKRDSRASVLTMGLLGDKYVELSSGSPEAAAVGSGSIIKGAAQVDMEEVMQTGADSVRKVNEFIEKINNLVSNFEKSEGSAARFLKDPALYENLKETSEALSMTMKEIQGGRGTIGMLIREPSLYNRLSNVVSSMETFSNKLNDGAGRFASSAESIEKFAGKLNSGSGTLNRLVEDRELYDNLNRTSKHLDAILEKIDSGEGVAGAIISDEGLANELKGTIGELRELTKDIREHPRKYFKFSLF